MKYWSLLAAKLVVGAGVLYAIWLAMYRWYPFPAYYASHPQDAFMHDLPWTTLNFVYNLLCNAALFFIILDQRYRCRTCGRRVRMPVSSGSHANVIFGPPRTDYICVYGHGTLKVPETQLTGRESPNWKKNDDDMWKELFSTTGKRSDDD